MWTKPFDNLEVLNLLKQEAEEIRPKSKGLDSENRGFEQ